jgi:hypothetical protein
MRPTMKLETNVACEMARDYAKGFGIVVGVSVGLGIVGWFLLQYFGADIEPAETLRLVLMLCLLALLTIGGEIAFSLLFANKNIFGGRSTFMHFLGGISAWISAFYIGPLMLDYVESAEAEEECETIHKWEFGPVIFSSKECDG